MSPGGSGFRVSDFLKLNASVVVIHEDRMPVCLSPRHPKLPGGGPPRRGEIARLLEDASLALTDSEYFLASSVRAHPVSLRTPIFSLTGNSL